MHGNKFIWYVTGSGSEDMKLDAATVSHNTDLRWSLLSFKG